MSQMSIFWKAAVITAIIFGLGVLLGYSLENQRISQIEKEYKQVELEWADAKLQSLYYQSINEESCKAAIDENLKFADKVYQQGVRLEVYDEANQITEKTKLEKQRYALLKTEFLLNSLQIKSRCKDVGYVNLLYFYRDEPSSNEKSGQKVQSVMLRDVKEMFGPALMLIPLPIDMDISMINIIKASYNITSVPTVMIDNKKYEGVMSQDQLLTELCSHYKDTVDVCKTPKV